MFAPIRKDELDVLVKSLKKAALVGEAVNVSDVVETLIEDIVFKMILGRSKYQQFDLKMIVRQTMILFGAFNLADYVTWMGYFDLQFDIKAVLLDLTLAGIDTSTSVVEWALSELLRNSRVMKNLQDEIQNEIGCMRMIEEKDLKKLSYLDMVVDEILRLYPFGPLLVPRECRENITIDGYFIEKKSRVIVNAWAIGRDPDVWSQNAEEFYPERFIDKKMNFHGQEFECIPFGSGRRRCPGIHFGLTTVKLVLAQLVHCFNWELPHDITPSNLNMEEKFGLTMPRAHHLYAIPRYRLVTN